MRVAGLTNAALLLVGRIANPSFGIAGRTPGSIPPGVGSGLLVDEELARAVRHESAAAVMHWWGVGHNAVRCWRKALGVGRTDSEGSRRLIQAAAKKGAQATKAREWTDEECDQRSLTSIELGLVQYLPTGYHGPR